MDLLCPSFRTVLLRKEVGEAPGFPQHTQKGPTVALTYIFSTLVRRAEIFGETIGSPANGAQE